MAETFAVEGSFEEFVSTWGGRLLGTALLLTGDLADAEDLLQDVLERLYPRWDSINDPLAYTRTAMSRALTDRWRRAGRRPRQVPLAERHDRPLTDGAAERATRSEIVDHLRQLPPRQRVVIVLRYFEDWSEEQIAEELDIARGTVKSQAAKGMTTLRRLMTSRDATDPSTRDIGHRTLDAGRREEDPSTVRARTAPTPTSPDGPSPDPSPEQPRRDRREDPRQRIAPARR